MNVQKRDCPIIVLGMHRSGTKVLSQILECLGVCMGKRKEGHNESKFFKNLNEKMLQICHSYWDVPSNTKNLLKNTEIFKEVEKHIKNKLESNFKFLVNHIGLSQTINFLKDEGFSWGWKDPRNTLFIPIWKSLFPDAKFIFIYRNGIDVAKSIQRREQKRKHKLLSKKPSIKGLNLESAFKLWEEYNEAFFSSSEDIENNSIFYMSYEELIKNPHDKVVELCNFLDIDPGSKRMDFALKKINRQSAYKFFGDSELEKLYSKRKSNRFMKRLGYSNISKTEF